MSQVEVSYGILHYNPDGNIQAHQAFVRAVCSLANHARLPHEVFVIDQGNGEREALLTQNIADELGFHFVGLKRNVGISRGINLLANMARGRYVSLVTSDVEFTPDLDVNLVKTLETNADVWQICPASDQSDIIYQKHDFQASGIVRTFAQELTIQFWPRDVFRKVGYFDERWKACYENLDYAVRIFMAGGYAAISHDTFCPHDFHMSMRSGARDHAYEGYEGMRSGFDQSVLQQLWEAKWPGLRRYEDLYRLIDMRDLDSRRSLLRQQYPANLYLPYVQTVGY